MNVKSNSRMQLLVLFIIAASLVTIAQAIITTGVVYLMSDFSVSSTQAQWSYSIPACCRSHDTVKRLYFTQILCKSNILFFIGYIPFRIGHMLFFNFIDYSHNWQDSSGNRKRHHNALCPDSALEIYS